MKRRRLVPICALGTSLAVLTAGSFLPEWIVWRFGSLDIVGHEANLWDAMRDLRECQRGSRDSDEFWRLQYDNAFNAAALVLIAVGVGLAAFGFGRIGQRRVVPTEAADYKEVAGGAVSDGRVDSPPDPTLP